MFENYHRLQHNANSEGECQANEGGSSCSLWKLRKYFNQWIDLQGYTYTHTQTLSMGTHWCLVGWATFTRSSENMYCTYSVCIHGSITSTVRTYATINVHYQSLKAHWTMSSHSISMIYADTYYAECVCVCVCTNTLIATYVRICTYIYRNTYCTYVRTYVQTLAHKQFTVYTYVLRHEWIASRRAHARITRCMYHPEDGDMRASSKQDIVLPSSACQIGIAQTKCAHVYIRICMHNTQHTYVEIRRYVNLLTQVRTPATLLHACSLNNHAHTYACMHAHVHVCPCVIYYNMYT